MHHITDVGVSRALMHAAVLFGACFGLVAVTSVEAANDDRPHALTAVELAEAFTAALNAHDVDALVDLFTEEDSGPTINADRSAWQKFEIALWAQRQVRSNIFVDAYDYRPTDHGVAWDADVYRDDWAAFGVETLRVTNSVWVHQGKVATFTSVPRDPRDAERLANLWRPGSAPEGPAK
jgi:hypothetical protein